MNVLHSLFGISSSATSLMDRMERGETPTLTDYLMSVDHVAEVLPTAGKAVEDLINGQISRAKLLSFPDNFAIANFYEGIPSSQKYAERAAYHRDIAKFALSLVPDANARKDILDAVYNQYADVMGSSGIRPQANQLMVSLGIETALAQQFPSRDNKLV